MKAVSKLQSKQKKQTKKMKKITQINNTRRIRKLSGGRAKINFAYTYFAITPEAFRTLPNFQLYIKNKHAECNFIDGSTVSYNLDTSPLLDITDTQILLIIVKYPFIGQFNKNIQLLELSSYQQVILSHSIIDRQLIWPGNYKYGICSICLHDKSKVGYESVIINIILSFLRLIRGPSSGIAWIGIKIENPQFLKLLNNFTSFGFKYPFITNKDPNGKLYDYYFLLLSSKFEFITSQLEYI